MGKGYTPRRLAELTATPPERLRSLEQLGLLRCRDDGSYDADAVERVTLVRHAEARGITDAQIEEFCREHGDLLASLLANLPTAIRTHTVEEVRAQLGPDAMGAGFLSAFLELVGPGPSDALTEEDIAGIQMARDIVALGFPAEALLQMVRVFAEALDRIAEAESRVFHDYVHERYRAEGLGGRALFEATEALSRPMIAMTEPALLYMHRRAAARARREDFVRHVVEDTTAPAPPGEASATFVFIDLAGFTPMTLTMGDSVAADVLARFASVVRTAVTRRHGRIVKQIGDAFMLVFDAAANAVLFGIDVSGAVAAESHFPAVHIGAHHGMVLYRDGDYVGTAVNLAARVAGASAAGQFLITSDLAAAARDLAGVALDALPPLALKGIEPPPRLFQVRTGPAENGGVDPVCGMQIRAGDEHATAVVGGERYVFCSDDCHDRFVASPERYQRA